MKWLFVINKDSYFHIRDEEEIIWNSPKDAKKGDIIFVYTAAPYKEIGFVFKAITDPFEDNGIRKKWDRSAIKVNEKISILNTIKIGELKDNIILSQSDALRRGFRGSHFKFNDEEYNELKSLILEKNPNLKKEIELLRNRC